MATVHRTPAESRVVLHNVDWDTYERLLAAHADSSSPRFTYDRGELEVMSPLPEHERFNRDFEALMSIVSLETGLDMESLGSTTFRREAKERGFEPDSCYYIQNVERVRGKERIDLSVDPPPDLVVEIEITSPAIPKLPIYASFGVPEVWRYDGRSLHIHVLEGGEYVEADGGRCLPGLRAVDLAGLLEESRQLERAAWLRRVRDWARGVGGDHPRNHPHLRS